MRRSESIAECMTWMAKHASGKEDPSAGDVRFEEAVDMFVKATPNLLDGQRNDQQQSRHSSTIAKISKESKVYFKTGNCELSVRKIVCVNPTFLQPTTGKWVVYHGCCPYSGFSPLPLKKFVGAN